MNPVRQALYDQLAGHAPLVALLGEPDGIYYRQAPRHAAPPFVVFDMHTPGVPEWTFAATALQSDLWLVKAIDRGSSPSAAEAVAATIDEALKDAPLTAAGQTVLYLRRQLDVNYGEPDGAELFHHVGALYRLVADRS